jgi:hypothetical protein
MSAVLKMLEEEILSPCMSELCYEQHLELWAEEPDYDASCCSSACMVDETWVVGRKSFVDTMVMMNRVRCVCVCWLEWTSADSHLLLLCSAASAQAKWNWFLAQNQQSNRHVLLYIDLLSFFFLLFGLLFFLSFPLWPLSVCR